jgi:hypothetical protein
MAVDQDRDYSTKANIEVVAAHDQFIQQRSAREARRPSNAEVMPIPTARTATAIDARPT